ncbi:MAG: thiamine-phosphate kinase [Lentisphaeria bacterium]
MTEDQLYTELFARLPSPPEDVVVPPGDDCAAIRTGGERVLLLAVDQIVGGRHYYENGPDAASPEEVAHKLLARNLSDIAAMGGTPRHALVAISQHCGPDWLRQFYDGLITSAQEYDVYPIGGDWATSGKENICSLTIIGDVAEDVLVRRSGAEPGDCLFATGVFGQSLTSGHHLAFTPRCTEGRWLAENAFPKAMIDVSDGLVLDAGRLCAASDVAVGIDAAKIPRRTSNTTDSQALSDGEDYELLFAVDPGKVQKLKATWPFNELNLTKIGVFKRADSPQVTDISGGPLNIASTGYDHLQ